jgi:hypothetical protein
MKTEIRRADPTPHVSRHDANCNIAVQTKPRFRKQAYIEARSWRGQRGLGFADVIAQLQMPQRSGP